MGNSKLPGLFALMAAVLFASVSTAPASASSFTAGKVGTALITTSKNLVFTITGFEAKCSTIKFTGITEGTLEAGKYHTTTQRMHPEMEDCEAFGLVSGVTLTTKGCDFVLSADTIATEGKGEMANVDLVDHPGESCSGITLTADPIFSTCTAVLPKQTIAHAASYENIAGEKVRVTWTAAEIEVNVTQSTGFCPLTIGVHKGASGGTFTGTTDVGADGGFTWTK
jgi:hypothetical protein